jgi:branched-chain amino acid transport system ATP-binding protein
MLQLQDVHTYYGDSHILKGVSLEIKRGELATLLGRNGAGKTTTLRTIMGILTPRNGTIIFDGTPILGERPHQIASLGIGYVPEERAVFPSLSVLENLTLPAKKNMRGLWDLEKIYTYFPVLEEKKYNKGSQLSGGEQQMLAIARVLTTDLKLLLLDEPTEGLAPAFVRQIGVLLLELKKNGVTVLLVEQNTRFAMEVADQHHILYNGRICYTSSNDQFKTNRDVQLTYLGV